MNALGACLYISEDLRGDGTYTVYSHEHEGEDTYQAGGAQKPTATTKTARAEDSPKPSKTSS
ncbi:hypothetical protein SAMN05216582_12051 [Selenomonas ruminantium]|uniref:Uncharacterized protein n=1 Tax=Selenomonas ruminantium TaxID=971 RepID=A0A1M6VSE6_SELRU|nr:hypothetical protein SAMN05216582_12051 [Selenomonas ruminantium]